MGPAKDQLPSGQKVAKGNDWPIALNRRGILGEHIARNGSLTLGPANQTVVRPHVQGCVFSFLGHVQTVGTFFGFFIPRQKRYNLYTRQLRPRGFYVQHVAQSHKRVEFLQRVTSLIGPHPQIVIARYKKNACKFLLQSAQGIAHRVGAVSYISGHNHHIIGKIAIGKPLHPPLVLLVIDVQIRNGKNTHGLSSLNSHRRHKNHKRNRAQYLTSTSHALLGFFSQYWRNTCSFGQNSPR